MSAALAMAMILNLALPAQAASDTLTLRPEACTAQVFLNGRPLSTAPAGRPTAVTLALQAGANVLALKVAAAKRAVIEASFSSLAGSADSAGPWLIGPTGGTDWLQGPQPPDGFVPAQVEANRIKLTAGDHGLRQVINVPASAPAWFPKMDRAFAVCGTSQLIKPYLPDLGLPLAYDYELALLLPSGVAAAACDGGVGAMPSDFDRRSQRDGELCILRYRTPPATPFGIYICWGDSNGTTISYQPVIPIGGTYNWRRLKARVLAPPGARYAHPIVLKWAGDRVVGEAWIDNIALRPVDAPQKNLVPAGDFEGGEWTGAPGLANAGPDGSPCLHVVLREKDKTRGWWVPREGKASVHEGQHYVLEADVKAQGIHVPGSRPHAAVLVRCDRQVPPGEYTITLWGASRLAGARALPIRSAIHVLPPLRNRRPDKVRLMPCYYSDPFSSDEVIRAFAENAYASGITWTYGSANCKLARLLRPRGHRVVCAYSRQPFIVGGAILKLLKEHPDVQAIKFDGKPAPATACPTWFLSDAGAAARQELLDSVAARLQTGPSAGFDWDIEQPVVEPPNFCTCPRCLAAFAQFAGLPGVASLRPEDLLKPPLRDRWVEFRCRQNARLVELVGAHVHKLQPGIEFSVYSGYHGRRTREHYGVDWALLAPFLDAAMSGYGFSPQAERATMQAVAPKPYLPGEMYYLSPTDDRRPAPRPETWANRLLRQVAFSGGHGVVIWYLPVFDGAAFYQTSIAAELIARYEDYFTRGQHCEGQFQVSGLEQYDWSALRWRDRALLLFLNFQPQARTISLRSDRWRCPPSVRLEPFARKALTVDRR